MVFDAVDEQLMHQPTVETRNRKPMRPNPVAPWELRIEELRVLPALFVDEDGKTLVDFQALGPEEI